MHDHAVVAAQPQVVQARSEGCPAIGELPVGDGLVSVKERDPFGMLGEQLAEHLVERAVLPVPGSAIARREFGRKRDDAGERWHRDGYVVALKPPSMTTVSPVTNGLLMSRLRIVSATSSGVTQRRRGVSLARRSIKRS